MGKFQEQIILIFFQTLPDNKNVALFNSFKNASIIKPGQCRNVSLQEKKGNLQASLNHEYWCKMPSYSILNLCLKEKRKKEIRFISEKQENAKVPQLLIPAVGTGKV